MPDRKQLEEAGLTDFRVFLAQVWDFLRLPPPTPVQNDIARHLQNGSRREIIEAFRGVGKSWITVAFVLWVLLLDPEKKIMVVSAGEQLASDFTKFCMTLIQGMPLLQHLAPRAGQKNSAVAFDVCPARPSKDPSVKSVGITGQLTGSRADVIVADDVETPKNSYTHLLRERLAELVKEFDAVLKPDGRVIYLGTPQIEQTLYNRLEGRGYKITIWPAEVPASITAYSGRLAQYVIKLITKGVPAGTPIDPKRFTGVDLEERRLSYGRAGYALQYMLDTNPSDVDKHPLKLKNLIIHDCDPEMGHVRLVWGGLRDQTIQDLEMGGFDGDSFQRYAWASPEMAKYTTTVMAIDPSGKGSDETAYAIVKNLHGLLYAVDIGGFVDGFGEATLATLAGKAARWGVNKVIIERNYGGGMFDQLLKPHLVKAGAGGIDDEWDAWSSTQKEQRILDVLAPLTESHRLVIHRKVIENDLLQQREQSRYSFVQQYTRMSRVKGALPNEDRLEALSMACSYFAERVSRDTEKAEQDFKRQALMKELAKIQKHFGMNSKPRNNWIHSQRKK